MLVNQVMRGMALDVNAICMDAQIAAQVRRIARTRRSGKKIQATHACHEKGPNFVKSHLDTTPIDRSANVLRHDPLLEIRHGGAQAD